jgi:hypothetical protein
MPESALPVEFLFKITATTANRTQIPNGPQGSRSIVAVTGGTFEGPKLKGTVVESPGGDWLTVRGDGSFRLDVRVILRTDDGAHILMTYSGIGTAGEGGARLRTAPQFETGDERYAWLNRIQAVGIGAPAQGSVAYDIYGLL